MELLLYPGQVPVPESDSKSRHRALGLLLLSIALLLYGSLYPWQFRVPATGVWGRFWDVRHVNNEFLLNVLLYVPVGFLAMNATGRPVVSIAIGCILSAGIESVQPYFDRYGRALDLLANGAGTVAGTVLALLLARSHRRVLLPPRPALILAVWIFQHLWPFNRVGHGFHVAWLSATPLLVTGLVEACAAWVAAGVLAVLSWPDRPRLAIALVAGVVVLEPVLCARPLERADIAGCFVLLAAAVVVRADLVRFARPVGLVVAGALLLGELAPYAFSPAPRPFNWVPFATLLSYDWTAAVRVTARKAFTYATVIYLLGRPDRIGRTACWVAVAVCVLEWVQRWLPGRVPDITDPVLTFLMAAILVLLPPGRGLSKSAA